MDKRFVPLNALIAFCTDVRTSWPRPLKDAGYQLSALEFPVTADETRVVPDIVAWSATEGHFAVGEAKSGLNVDEDQARRYGVINSNVMVQTLGVTVATENPVDTDVIYAVLDEDDVIERVQLGLNRVGVTFPVLAIGNEQVHHVAGTFKSAVLAAVFAEPIPVSGPPPGLITIDDQSLDADFDRVVYASLVAAMARRSPAITVPALAEDALPYLAYYPNGYKDRLIRRVNDAARRAEAASGDLFVYEPRSGTRNTHRIRFINSPEESDPRGRTQRYQSLSTRFSAPGRRRRTVVSEDQLTLFGGNNLEQELAELDIEDDGDGEGVSDGPQ